jgi:hypothetical protein
MKRTYIADHTGIKKLVKNKLYMLLPVVVSDHKKNSSIKAIQLFNFLRFKTMNGQIFLENLKL